METGDFRRSLAGFIVDKEKREGSRVPESLWDGEINQKDSMHYKMEGYLKGVSFHGVCYLSVLGMGKEDGFEHQDRFRA